jgi:hypothetical protein
VAGGDVDGSGTGHTSSEGEKMPLLATLAPLLTWESWLVRRGVGLARLRAEGRSSEGEKLLLLLLLLLPALLAMLIREVWLVRWWVGREGRKAGKSGESCGVEVAARRALLRLEAVRESPW